MAYTMQELLIENAKLRAQNKALRAELDVRIKKSSMAGRNTGALRKGYNRTAPKTHGLYAQHGWNKHSVREAIEAWLAAGPEDRPWDIQDIQREIGMVEELIGTASASRGVSYQLNQLEFFRIHYMYGSTSAHYLIPGSEYKLTVFQRYGRTDAIKTLKGA